MPTLVEIVSPEKLLLSRSADMVVIPGSEGELGALQGHAPMIVALGEGNVRIYEGNQVVESYHVNGGFAEITANRVTVLATQASAGISQSPSTRPEGVGAA